jgi:hypothetical protein
MLQKTSLSPYDRVTSAWREMRKRVGAATKGTAARPAHSGPDYFVEALLEEGVGLYRIFRPATDRKELARRMQELAELMRRKNYSGALIDMRDCRFETGAAARSLSEQAVLPYAVNPLWRLALMVSEEEDPAPYAMFDALLKLHHRAGVQMRMFDDYSQALQWLRRAREGQGARL